MSWEGEGGARAQVWLPSLPPTIYRAKGEGGAALALPPRKVRPREESILPKAPRRCLPPLGLFLSLDSWRMGLLGLVPLAHVGQGAPPLSFPLRLGLETLGVGGAPPDLGGKFPPLAAAPP